jgi:hypothetical protein
MSNGQTLASVTAQVGEALRNQGHKCMFHQSHGCKEDPTHISIECVKLKIYPFICEACARMIMYEELPKPCEKFYADSVALLTKDFNKFWTAFFSKVSEQCLKTNMSLEPLELVVSLMDQFHTDESTSIIKRVALLEKLFKIVFGDIENP